MACIDRERTLEYVRKHTTTKNIVHGRSHVCVETASADLNSIAEASMETAADGTNDIAYGHANSGSGSEDPNEDAAAHVDEGTPINEHGFENRLR